MFKATKMILYTKTCGTSVDRSRLLISDLKSGRYDMIISNENIMILVTFERSNSWGILYVKCRFQHWKNDRFSGILAEIETSSHLMRRKFQFLEIIYLKVRIINQSSYKNNVFFWQQQWQYEQGCKNKKITKLSTCIHENSPKELTKRLSSDGKKWWCTPNFQ